MKKRLLLNLLLLSYSFCIFSQNELKKIVDSVEVLIELSDKQNLGSNYEEALKYATLAVKHAKTVSNNKELEGRAYICLANTYQMVSDNNNAEKYFNIALENGKVIDDYFLKAASLNGLANVFSQDESTADKAANYYETSIEYAIEANKLEHVFIAYLNASIMYLDFDEPNKAYPYLLKTAEYFDKLKNNNSLYFTMLNLYYADYYAQKNNHNTALTYIVNARDVAEEHKLFLDLIDIYELKSRIHQQRGEYDLAIESLKQQQHYKDQIFNSEKIRQIEEIKADFEVSEYEHAAKISESKTTTTIITAIGLSLLLSSIFLIFYLKRKRKTLALLEKKNIELVESKNDAEHANKLKSELLVNLSHELRTPLYGILGITSMLMDESKKDPKQIELLNSLRFSGEYLKNLINNLLRNEEIEANTITITKKQTNLHQLVIDIANLFMLQAKENQNKLRLNISQSVGKVYNIDDDKLSEILVNLLSNANKFTSGGSVEVKLELEKKHNNTDTISFTISDTGIGIPEEMLDNIFESFKQVETNTAYGAGLGLSIAKHLIEVMGGTIQVKSELNKGSEFSFSLNFETIIETNDELVINNKDLNILLVEDNKINQIVTKKLLTTIGHECTLTKNGLEAVEICKVNDYDLVLMDINMPVMNGFDATKSIKLFKPELKIIALTALEVSEIKTQCTEAGIDDVINKPISKTRLKDIIQMHAAT